MDNDQLKAKIALILEWARANPQRIASYQRFAQIAVGGFLIWFVYAIGARHFWLLRYGAHTEGTIVRLERIETPMTGFLAFGKKVTYKYIVQFHLHNHDVEFPDWIGTKSPSGRHHMNVGRKVPVLYDPNDPSNAETDRPVATYIMAGFFLVGAFLVLVGLFS